MNKCFWIFLSTRIAVIALLFWALGIHLDSYYLLLRWMVFLVAGCAAYRFYKLENPLIKYSGIVIFVAVAILFNPIMPVHLNQRSLWKIIDIAVGALFALSFMFV